VQARSLHNLERIDDAVVALEQALAFDAEYGHALNLLGLIRIHQGRYADAVEPLRLAARYEPELPYVQANLGRALELDGRYADAVLAFRAALDLDPALRSAQISLARAEAAAAATPDRAADEDSPAVAAMDETGRGAVVESDTDGTPQ
jgi:tetratricopeptide (TPR) repeat protein